MGTHDAHVEPGNSQVEQSGANPGGGAAGGFHGSSRHPVDAKGRLFVPKRFLPGLPFSSEGQVPVTVQPSPDGRCLWLRPGTLPERSAEEFAAAGPRQRGAWRRQSALTIKATLDASKRVLLTPELLKEFGIEREVVMVGIGPAVEIWAASTWEESQATFDADFRGEQDALEAEERARRQEEEHARLERERRIRTEQQLAEQEELRARADVAELRLRLARAEQALRELGVDPEEGGGA